VHGLSGVATYQTSTVDGLSCEDAFVEERPLWRRADFHGSKAVFVLQGVPVVDYSEDMREDRYGDGVSESCPGVGPV
jgi:hypothetical protein